MKFKIVAVGKIKDGFYKDAIAEYVKRTSRFCTVEIVEVAVCICFGEVAESFFNGEPSAKDIEKIINAEGQSILAKTEGYVVATDIQGKQFTSEELSKHITANKQNYSTFTFVIGGSYGLSQEVKQRADLRLSFGKITLPHQLFRVILCEQLYRACCIENNVPYHK